MNDIFNQTAKGGPTLSRKTIHSQCFILACNRNGSNISGQPIGGLSIAGRAPSIIL